MTRVEAVISDFGGVLTSPLMHAFAAYQDRSGIPVAALGQAMRRVADTTGEHPLFELEKGRITEQEFLDRLGRGLEEVLERPVAVHDFADQYWHAIEPNEQLFAYYRALSGRGVRMAMLTNNVREWEPRWRRMLPIDEIFEIVVDSAFVGMRKPDPAIYELTLERLGLPAAACAFVDDLEHNIVAARELGLRAVHYRDTEQAIAELDALLAE